VRGRVLAWKHHVHLNVYGTTLLYRLRTLSLSCDFLPCCVVSVFQGFEGGDVTDETNWDALFRVSDAIGSRLDETVELDDDSAIRDERKANTLITSNGSVTPSTFEHPRLETNRVEQVPLLGCFSQVTFSASCTMSDSDQCSVASRKDQRCYRCRKKTSR
jgi:hypothetical protein